MLVYTFLFVFMFLLSICEDHVTGAYDIAKETADYLLY